MTATAQDGEYFYADAHRPLPPMAALRQAFLSGEISPIAVTLAVLKRIEKFAHLGAFVQIDREGALEAAAASEDRYRRGESYGPLDGMAISVKDIISVAGLRCEAGSAVLSGRRPAHDAAVVAALRDAGAVIVGKTALDEFALTTTGPVVNPVFETLTAGGSSCGAAVAVRMGMSFADVATDTGGSVRIPSYCCHVTGLKPTHSLLSAEGVLPLARTLDHPGVVARTAADVAVVLEALVPGGLTPGADLSPSPTSIRIGVPTNLHFYGRESERVYWRAVRELESAGMRRVDIELPDLSVVADVHQTVLRTEMRDFHGRRFGRDEDRYGAGLHQFIWGQPAVTEGRYVEALKMRANLSATVSEQLTGCDVLALPTLLVDIPAADQMEIDLDGEPTFATSAMVRLTALLNHTGHPALTVALNAAEEGLFDSIQLVARHFDDAFLLAVGKLCQDLSAAPTSSHQRRPAATLDVP